MPARKKPISTKQKKAELQLKRAQKRGDVEKPPPDAKARQVSRRRGRPRTGHDMLQPDRSAVADASRRLESSFVKFSPAFLEEAKQKASTIIPERPIPLNALPYPVSSDLEGASSELTVMRRPKWKHDMSKKEVENNEAGLFRKWLEESDTAVRKWAELRNGDSAAAATIDTHDQYDEPEGSENIVCERDRMPMAPPMFERNLEVWRQLCVSPIHCNIVSI